MTQKIMVLRPVNLGPGRYARPGEVHEVAPELAHAAVSYGNARQLTDEELAELEGAPPGTVETRDPSPTTRDPRVRRK